MLLGPRLGSLWSICGHWLVKPLIPFLLDPPTIVTLMDVYLWSSSCFTNYCRGSKRKPLLSDMSQNEGVDRKQDKCDSRDWDVYRTRRFRVMVLDTIQVLLVCRAWINRNFLRVKKALIRKQFSDQIRELYYNVIINVRLIFSFVSCSFAHNVTTFRHRESRRCMDNWNRRLTEDLALRKDLTSPHHPTHRANQTPTPRPCPWIQLWARLAFT